MPKHNVPSDSDSDSGPDSNPPSKKMKPSGSSGYKKQPKINDEGAPYWDIGARKRLTVREFKGTMYIDIREFYEKDGKSLPGKKGVSLRAGEWDLVKDLLGDVDVAVRK